MHLPRHDRQTGAATAAGPSLILPQFWGKEWSGSFFDDFVPSSEFNEQYKNLEGISMIKSMEETISKKLHDGFLKSFI